MTDPIPLRLLQDEVYDYTDDTQDIETFAAAVGIPEEFTDDLTGCVIFVIDGDIEEAYFTESNRPFDLEATYYEPEYWIDDEEEEAWDEQNME